jgi:hypothetical protein
MRSSNPRPAESAAQQKFMGAELARKRAGEQTKTNMSERQLKEFAGTKRKGLPSRVTKRK